MSPHTHRRRHRVRRTDADCLRRRTTGQSPCRPGVLRHPEVLVGADSGYQKIRVTFRLEGDYPEKLRRLIEQSRLRSAVYDVITNGVPVSIEVTA